MERITSRYAAAAGFVGSGLALAAFPLLRPYGPEEGLTGAADFASSAWVVSHLLGAAGFVALALGLRAWSRASEGRQAESLQRTETLAWLAAVLVLPFYGAESFGLQAIGAHVVARGDVAALEAADAFRADPTALSLFGAGLVLLAVVGARVAVTLWSSGRLGRTAGVLVAAGLMTYLPQYLGGPGLRMAHGVLLGVGLILTGLVVAQARDVGHPESAGPSDGRPAEVAATPN